MAPRSFWESIAQRPSKRPSAVTSSGHSATVRADSTPVHARPNRNRTFALIMTTSKKRELGVF